MKYPIIEHKKSHSEEWEDDILFKFQLKIDSL